MEEKDDIRTQRLILSGAYLRLREDRSGCPESGMDAKPTERTAEKMMADTLDIFFHSPCMDGCNVDSGRRSGKPEQSVGFFP